MTAPTSPKPTTPADPNDLRTALTKLADEQDAQTGPYARILHTVELRALLAAHPAPETAEARCLADTSWEHHDRTDDFPCSSCVSDTRREDVGLALIESHIAEFEASIARLEVSIQDPNNTVGGREYDTAKLHGQRGAVYALRRLADALAVLPAPPVVANSTEAQRYKIRHAYAASGPGDYVQRAAHFDAVMAPPVVDEAGIEAAAITEARVRFRRQRMNVGTSQDREEQAFREGAVFAARLRGADRG